MLLVINSPPKFMSNHHEISSLILGNRSEKALLLLDPHRCKIEVLAPKFVTGLVGIAVTVAGAVAIARSSVNRNISSFPKAQATGITCPKIAWPYGCDWRASAAFVTKNLPVRRSRHRRVYRSIFR
jgi:hypothetical protein